MFGLGPAESLILILFLIIILVIVLAVRASAKKRAENPAADPSPSTPQRVCAQCGARLDYDAKFCTQCGAVQPELTTTELASVLAQVQQQSTAKSPVDTEGSFGFALLGFLVPVVGLILYVIWYRDRPGPAKSAGKGAIAGVITSVIIGIIYFIAIAAITKSALGA